jgi:hypothetical protein
MGSCHRGGTFHRVAGAVAVDHMISSDAERSHEAFRGFPPGRCRRTHARKRKRHFAEKSEKQLAEGRFIV